jgi:hypothetical protein
MDSTCFACRPGPNTGEGARWLCWEHKRACALSDGASLYATLALAEPPDGPLEGSALGWLYSPVYVVDARGIRVRAWTSFAAGGMAVLEDRFGAEDPFEFWMCEREDAVGLLAELSARGDPSRAGALASGPEGLRERSREALDLAQDMWLWRRQIKARHDALGRWPASFEELTAVLTGVTPRAPVDAADTAFFFENLRRLAIRRYQGRRAPA